jgi:PAS domain S-box-containing protein
MYQDRNDRTFGQGFPEAWARISTSESGQVETSNGLFGYETIYPFLDAHLLESGTAQADEPAGQAVDSNVRSWKLVVHVTADTLSTALAPIRDRFLLLSSILVALTAGGAWALARVSTGRRQAEKEVRLQSAALESAANGIVITDTEGTIMWVNKAFTALTGYTAEEATGQNPRLVGSGEHDPRFYEDLWKTITSGRVWHGEIINRRKDGSFYTEEETITPVRNESGEITNFIAIKQDITERKLAEEAQRKSNAALAVANRELEAFSYSVSHDLRAPLRGIDGFSQALLEDYPDRLDEQGKDYLQRVRSATQRMGALIDDMLSLSRVTRSEMKRETVDLSALAQSITEELQTTQPERRAEFVIASGLTASGDARLLQVLLVNLLDNAWKFTGKHPQARVEFGCTQVEGEPAYFVRDDGAGFDMTYADKLFGTFQRLHTEAEFPGTGIGLATVQRIVHRHGGRVWAEGKVEEGATFHFTLQAE